MNVKILRVIVLGLALVGMAEGAERGVAESSKDLRATIQKWIAVMKETQETQQEWKRNKQILEDTREALGLEVEQLKSEIAAAEKRIATADSASAEKLERKRSYEAGREALRASLDRVEDRVSEVLPLLPEELATAPKMEAAIADHRKFAAAEDSGELSLNKRLTAMLTILSEAEKFNQLVQVFSSRPREVDGEERLFDVLYFGSSLGYAVDQDGSLAFQLHPGPDGWKSQRIEGADEAKAVRELVDVANKSGETKLVRVPLELAD